MRRAVKIMLLSSLIPCTVDSTMPCYQSHYDRATAAFTKEPYSKLGYGVLLLHLDMTDNTALTVYFDNKALKNIIWHSKDTVCTTTLNGTIC